VRTGRGRALPPAMPPWLRCRTAASPGDGTSQIHGGGTRVVAITRGCTAAAGVKLGRRGYAMLC
jgi:hypothetical protein